MHDRGLCGAAAGGGGLHKKNSGAEQKPVQAERGKQRQDCCGQDGCESEDGVHLCLLGAFAEEDGTWEAVHNSLIYGMLEESRGQAIVGWETRRVLRDALWGTNVGWGFAS